MSPYISNKETQAIPTVYHLYGVVNHVGSMETGHYTALCRNFDTGQWHKFDDEQVDQLDSSAVQSSAAYMLFYSATVAGV